MTYSVEYRVQPGTAVERPELEKALVEKTIAESLAVLAAYTLPVYKALKDADFPDVKEFPEKIHIQIVFSSSPEFCGVGSGAWGSAKVFWGPVYNAHYPSSFCDPRQAPLEALGVYALAHEIHHACGGHHLPALRVPFLVLITTWNVLVGHLGGFWNPDQQWSWFMAMRVWLRPSPRRPASRAVINRVTLALSLLHPEVHEVLDALRDEIRAAELPRPGGI